MRKIIDYGVLHSCNEPKELTNKVVEQIKEGWEPFGSRVVSVIGDTEWFYQPMARYN